MDQVDDVTVFSEEQSMIDSTIIDKRALATPAVRRIAMEYNVIYYVSIFHAY